MTNDKGCLQMIPLVFPHTYLSERMMQRLSLVFPRVGVYLPSDLDVPAQMRRWADSGRVDLRFPVTGDTRQMAAVLKAFRSWASAQSGGAGVDLSLLKAYHSHPPFLDAPFAAQIQTDIRQRSTSPPADPDTQPSESDRLFNARVFLSIAQQLDEQADALDRDYAAVDSRQQELLRELQPDQRPGAAGFGPRADVNDSATEPYMPAERLDAWAQLAAADPIQSGPDATTLFVTGSRQVWEQVVEPPPEGAALDHLPAVALAVEMTDSLDRWRQAFMKTIAELTGGGREPSGARIELPDPPPAADNRDSVRLELVRFPCATIADVLLRRTTSPDAAAADTLIAYLGSAWEIS